MIAGTEEQGVETPEETAFYHRMMDESSQRLKAMKDKYKGGDCILIGNGPSLLKTNLDLIRGKHIFAANAFYMFIDKFNIHPTFFGLSDGSFLPSFGDDVLKIDTQLFLTRSVEIQYLRNYDHYSGIVKQEPVLVRSLLPEMTESHKFSKDISEGIYSGWTVIIDIGLQLAYYLGFQRAILIGCDCCANYDIGFVFYEGDDYITVIPDSVRGTKVTVKCESCHREFERYKSQLKSHIFCSPYCRANWEKGNEPIQQEYQKAGTATPQWKEAYSICKQAWEADGREIINATVGGVLNTFPRKSLEELYQS